MRGAGTWEPIKQRWVALGRVRCLVLHSHMQAAAKADKRNVGRNEKVYHDNDKKVEEENCPTQKGGGCCGCRNNANHRSKEPQKWIVSSYAGERASPWITHIWKGDEQLQTGSLFMETKFDISGGKKGCAFLHITQIREHKVNDVSDVLKVGQQIDNAHVITIDHEKKEVAISLRKRHQARKDLSHYHIGNALKGRVKSIASYGAGVL
eukprot:scaffold318643_cov28-Attheya_sp.AAC.1